MKERSRSSASRGCARASAERAPQGEHAAAGGPSTRAAQGMALALTHITREQFISFLAHSQSSCNRRASETQSRSAAFSHRRSLASRESRPAPVRVRPSPTLHRPSPPGPPLCTPRRHQRAAPSSARPAPSLQVSSATEQASFVRFRSETDFDSKFPISKFLISTLLF